MSFGAPEGHCPRCEAALDAEAQRCKHCGLRLTCPACGAPYEDPEFDVFCSTCGTRVTKQPSAPADELPEDPEPVASAAAHARQAVTGKTKSVVSALADAGKGRLQAPAASAKAHLELPRPVRRFARRTLTRSVGELYLELGIALTKEGKLGEAANAFSRAMAEGVDQADVLDDFALAAADAGARGLALRAHLESALYDPQRTRHALKSADALLDDDSAADQGGWLLDEWYPRVIETSTDPRGRSAAAVLAARVALRIGDTDTAQARLSAAMREDRGTAVTRYRPFRTVDALEPRLRSDPATAHWILGRMLSTLERYDAALEHLDEALRLPVPEEQGGDLPVIELRAEVLAKVGRRREAAECYVQAGRLHDMALRHPAAVERFRTATELDPEHAVAFWYLADSRRLIAERRDYPYVDRDELAAAHTAWSAGVALALGDTPAWAHVSGSLILESLARFEADPRGLVLSAFLQSEQATALDPASADAWSHLARQHRMLRQLAAAWYAANHAHGLDAANPSVSFERVATAAELGLPDALDLLDHYARQFHLAEDPAVLALRGYILLLAQSLDEAMADLDRALEADPTDVWARARRSLCAALRGEDDDALLDAERVFAETASDRPRGRVAHGDDRTLAALVLGWRVETEEHARAGRGLIWQDQVELHMSIAGARALGGDRDGAERALEEALDLVQHLGDVRIVRLHLRLMARRTPGAAFTAVEDRLARLDSTFAERAWGIDDALAELDAAAAHVPRGTPAWIVARASQARLLSAEQRWSDAADAEEELLAYDDLLLGVPGARGRLERALEAAVATAVVSGDVTSVRSHHERLEQLGASDEVSQRLSVAAALRAAGDPAAAIVEAEEAAAAAQARGARQREQDAHILAGDALFDLGRIPEADAAYERAVEAGPDLPRAAESMVRRAWAAAEVASVERTTAMLLDALRTLRRDVGPAAARVLMSTCADRMGDRREPQPVATAVRLLAEHPQLEGAERRDVMAARLAVRRTSNRLQPLDPVAPVVVVAGRMVFPDGEEDASARELRDRGFRRLRRRIRHDSGVRVPGVAIRIDDLLGPSDFQILINDIPYMTGTIPVGASLVVGADGPGAEVDPWTGETAVWTQREAERNGSADPGRGIAWLLEGVLRTRLADFVSLAEVEFQLDEWRARGGVERLQALQRAAPRQPGRTRLTAVMHRLVRQQVPLTDLATILEVVGRLGMQQPIGDAVEAVRQPLGGVEPAVAGHRELLALDAGLEQLLSPAHAPLARHDARRALDALRELMGDRAPGQYAVVVEDARLRRRVQVLCERLVPRAAVVSRQELNAAGREAVRTT